MASLLAYLRENYTVAEKVKSIAELPPGQGVPPDAEVVVDLRGRRWCVTYHRAPSFGVRVVVHQAIRGWSVGESNADASRRSKAR